MGIKDKYDQILIQPYNFELSIEGKEYEACRFEYENKTILGRTAKLTPKKNGLFVTL